MGNQRFSEPADIDVPAVGRAATPALRPGRPADHPEILRIWRAASRTGHPFLTEADLDHDEALVAAEHLPAAQLTVAVCDDRVVGFAATSGDHLGALFVLPQAQGRGIGRRLLDALKARRTQLQLGVYEANQGARGVYDRAGFEVVGRDATDEAGRPYPVLRMRWSREAGSASLRAFRPGDDEGCRRLAARAALSSYGARMPHLGGLFHESRPLEPADVRIVAAAGDGLAGFVEIVGSHVSNLFVDPAFQGRGVGTQLLAEAEARIEGDVTLSVFQVNPDARRLYERLGYHVESDGEASFGGSAEPVWRMRKVRAGGRRPRP